MRYLIGLVLALGVTSCSEATGNGGTGGTDLCESVACEDDDNVCTGDGLCDPADGTCDYPPVEDGTACGAGGGTCQAGVCVAGVFPCTSQGIRHAIHVGGGPHAFDCSGPTVVRTESEIVIDNDVIIDGQGNLTIDGNQTHRVLSVSKDVVAEVRG